MQQLHTHVVLPGTTPLDGVDRTATYNNKERGHDALFREIASRHFSAALDRIVGPEWQLLREVPEIKPEQPAPNELDACLGCYRTLQPKIERNFSISTEGLCADPITTSQLRENIVLVIWSLVIFSKFFIR
jgi:hypothetical protein